MNPSRFFLLYLSRIPPVVMIVLILVLGVTTSAIVTSSINETKDALEAEKEALEEEANRKAEVVCAVGDISEGETISASSLTTREIPFKGVPSGSVTNSSNAAGRIAKFSIASGQIITARDLVLLGQPTGFQAKLPKGFRAVTFPVDTMTGVAGFIGPDSRVDIMAAIGSGLQTKAYTILSDVKVVAVGQEYQTSSHKTVAHQTNSVTVAVEPSDAAKLISAMAAGKLHCALRSDDDHSPVAINSLPYMRPETSPAIRLAPPPPPVVTMETIAQESVQDRKTSRSSFDVDVWLGRERDVISLDKK